MNTLHTILLTQCALMWWQLVQADPEGMCCMMGTAVVWRRRFRENQKKSSSFHKITLIFYIFYRILAFFNVKTSKMRNIHLCDEDCCGVRARCESVRARCTVWVDIGLLMLSSRVTTSVQSTCHSAQCRASEPVLSVNQSKNSVGISEVRYH